RRHTRFSRDWSSDVCSSDLAFQVNRTLAALATLGIIFAAVYMLWMYQRVAFGEVTHEENRTLPDLSLREWAVVMPLIVFIVWIEIGRASCRERVWVGVGVGG